MVLVYLILHCGENVTLRLVSDIWRGARCATRAGHDVACMGLPVHLDSPGQDSEVLALRLPGRRPATGLEAGAVIVAMSACGPAQCHASSESDCRHKPFKTRFNTIAKQNKNYLQACRQVPQLLKTFAKFEEVTLKSKNVTEWPPSISGKVGHDLISIVLGCYVPVGRKTSNTAKKQRMAEGEKRHRGQDKPASEL